MKQTLCLFAALVLSITLVEAQNKGNDKKKQEDAEKLKKKELRESNRKAVKEVLEEKDKNSDGSLSLDEYLTGESDAEAAKKNFEKYNENGDRFLSKKEIEKSLGL